MQPITGRFVEELAGPAQQTDRGIVLAEALVERLRQQRIILPTLDVIERVSSEALTRGTRLVYEALTGPLSDPHRRALDALLSVPEGAWEVDWSGFASRPVRQDRSHILVHLERLKAIRELGLPESLSDGA